MTPSPVRGEGIICNCPGDEDGQPHLLARARRVIRTHYRTLFVGLGWSLAAPPQPRITCYAPVVNLQVFVTSGTPLAASRMAVAPPRKVTVKLVFARRFAAGVIVTLVTCAPFTVTVAVLTVAAITPPPVRAIVAVVDVTPATTPLKVAVMAPALRLTFPALAAGLVLTTVGAAVNACVVKVHDVVANGAQVNDGIVVWA